MAGKTLQAIAVAPKEKIPLMLRVIKMMKLYLCPGTSKRPLLKTKK